MIALSSSSPHDADRLGSDDSAQRDDRDLGGAATDVDDHVAGGLVDRQPGTDGRGHGLLDDVHLACTGLRRCLDDGASLDPGDAGGHADDDSRAGQVTSLVDLQDEVAEHPLGDLEVGDHAVLQGPYGNDVARCTPDHLLGLGADRQDAAGVGVDGHDGRLVQDDAAPPDVHQRVGSPEVDSHVTADERH